MTHPGTILVAPGTPLPDCLQLEQGAPNANSWLLANPTHPSPRFERELQPSSGWTFFYLADTISAISINFNTAQAGQAAMKRLIAKAAARHCNALQVDQIAAHFFLGVPSARLSPSAPHPARHGVPSPVPRLAKLDGCVAILRGGAATEIEMKEQKARVEALREARKTSHQAAMTIV